MSAHAALVGLRDDELLRLAPGATHQHYKGGLYRLLGEVRDADDDGHLVTGEDRPLPQPRVVYQHLYPHGPGLWIRDGSQFHGTVELPSLEPLGQAIQVPRFRPLVTP